MASIDADTLCTMKRKSQKIRNMPHLLVHTLDFNTYNLQAENQIWLGGQCQSAKKTNPMYKDYPY